MPWKRDNNPFDEPVKPEPKPRPATLVEVICEGCYKPMNIRVEHRDNGKKIKNCRNDGMTIQVSVAPSGGVVVHQWSDKVAKHETSYEKVWQE